MDNNLQWEEVGAYNVARPDGSSEKYILSRSKKTGDFQIKNEYGNTVIDMELMSGIEFIRRVLDEMADAAGDDLNSDYWVDSLSDEDSTDLDCDDCDYTD